jgi:hypothetical protein
MDKYSTEEVMSILIKHEYSTVKCYYKYIWKNKTSFFIPLFTTPKLPNSYYFYETDIFIEITKNDFYYIEKNLNYDDDLNYYTNPITYFKHHLQKYTPTVLNNNNIIEISIPTKIRYTKKDSYETIKIMLKQAKIMTLAK